MIAVSQRIPEAERSPLGSPPSRSGPAAARALAWPLTIAIGIACAALVLAIRVWLEVAGALPGEQWVDYHVPDVRWDPGVYDVGLFFQALGTPAMALPTVALAAWFAGRASGWRGAAFVVLASCGVLVNAALKELSGQTPMMEAHSLGIGLNYPSGHTVYGVVLFGALAWLAWRRRLDIVVACTVLIIGMGISRVTFGAHFASDVIAGYLVGVAWLVLAAALTLPRPPAGRHRDKAGRTVRGSDGGEE